MNTPIDSANDQPKTGPFGDFLRRIGELRSQGMSIADAVRIIKRDNPEMVKLIQRHALEFGAHTIRPLL